LVICGFVCGCGGENSERTPKPPDGPYGPDLKLSQVEWKNREVVKTYTRSNTVDKAELVGESEVRQDEGQYVYYYTMTAKNPCKARWEILDHIQGKSVVYEMEKDKAITLIHKSKSPPVYVYRTATCFEGDKQLQVAFYTIIPLDKLLPRDPQP
jgi:hypothetical protein